MTDKHPNQAVALAYWQDPTQEWRYRPRNDTFKQGWSEWRKIDHPQFFATSEYQLRPHASKRPRRMRYAGGTKTFPEPMREAPKEGTDFWHSDGSNQPIDFEWCGTPNQRAWLVAGICQATEQGAKEQSAALAELSMEYVDET